MALLQNKSQSNENNIGELTKKIEATKDDIMGMRENIGEIKNGNLEMSRISNGIGVRADGILKKLKEA